MGGCHVKVALVALLYCALHRGWICSGGICVSVRACVCLDKWLRLSATTPSQWVCPCLSFRSSLGLCTLNGPGTVSEKLFFDPFLTHFWSQTRPIFKALWDVPWPKTRHHGLKTSEKHLFEHPEWSRITFGKTRFFTHFWSQNGPFSRHFGIFHGPKRATTGSKCLIF